MSRKRKKPQYDAAKIQKEMIDLAVELYHSGGNIKNVNGKSTGGSLRSIAEELDISVSKVV